MIWFENLSSQSEDSFLKWYSFHLLSLTYFIAQYTVGLGMAKMWCKSFLLFITELFHMPKIYAK